MNRRQEMLTRVQQLDFVMYDTSLYLNNQPDSEAALNLFSKYRALAAQAREEYEDAYGPLTHGSINADIDGWSWLNMPWPWQMED